MNVIVIKKNDHDEFEFPTEANNTAIYYTDDKEDAIGTAKMVYGDDVVTLFRRGTYGEQS